MSKSREPENDESSQDTGLQTRLRHGQTDLDEAIALLRQLDLDDLSPAATFDPGWPEESR